MWFFAAGGLAGSGSCHSMSLNQSSAPGVLPPMRAPRVLVEKSRRRLTLYDGDKVVRVYRVCTGSAAGRKQREGDRRTPEGQFHVCYKNPESKYTLSLGLSYPNEEDARRGLKDGLITPQQHDDIVKACRAVRGIRMAPEATTMPGCDWEALWRTPLGGEIMIHGAGAGRPGPAGCVGMDDRDIRELYPALPIGTPVRIVP